jgi:N-acetyl-gamma-glutamyl-phosphate reductase
MLELKTQSKNLAQKFVPKPISRRGSEMALTVAIAGASGYVGGELMRLVAKHPELELKTVTAKSNVGQSVSSLHPDNSAHADLVFVETNATNLQGHDVVFLAMPHSKSAEVASWLGDTKFILDCGADFRLENASDWEKFYGTKHAGTWSYGLPELTLAAGGKQRGRLKNANRVAVPGCNVTAITLGLAPALTAGLIEPSDIVSILSVGTSGAGRTAIAEKVSEGEGSSHAYGVGGVHRHTPEIEQNLANATGQKVSVSFTPVLVPMFRGILSVNTAKAKAGTTLSALREVYLDAYGDEQFIHVLDEGEFPNTGDLAGSNNATIGLSLDEHSGRVVIVCAIDNLVKGTAGAAIQSLNLALGFEESLGLEGIGFSS